MFLWINVSGKLSEPNEAKNVVNQGGFPSPTLFNLDNVWTYFGVGGEGCLLSKDCGVYICALWMYLISVECQLGSWYM